MNNFNDIRTRNDLADFLKIPRYKLTYVLYTKGVDNLYTSFEIPKKNGEVRHINAPIKDLKDVQRKLAKSLWEYQKNIRTKTGKNSNISHAFEKNKSIITNAKIHRNKRLVLNIDLKNFFDSFHFGRVKGFFEKNKDFQLSSEVAIVIAQLTCYKGCLPQGAPSSPIITNLICNILDVRLLKIAKKYKLDYTRYADDLTFSTNNKHFLEKQQEFHAELSKIIEHSGFMINTKKIRLQFRYSKQEVTGLTVNKKINVDRNYYKNTRSMAHTLYTKGSLEIKGEPGTINQLEGRFSFINQLDWYNNRNSNSKKCNFRNLNSREKQYQQFLFFKYFFDNQKPLIITEGITDVDYLKAALKNLHSEYPNLITKDSDGKFNFKVSFLKRTKRLKYFLNIQKDGADTLKNIYNYFAKKGNDTCTNYLDYFTKITRRTPTNPVILIFDNELNNKEKPLCKFVTHAGIKNEKKDLLKKSLKLNITKNLYLLTNPLIKNKEECEIEDLFDDVILGKKINGKGFCRNEKKFDNTKHYGKEIFAKYVSKNYIEINFNNFKYILNNLNDIIATYKNK